MFFSRRIGVGPDGVPVPIIGGGRLTGTLSGMKIGMLTMRTDAVKDLTDENQYSVLRIKKELPNRTHIGAMYTGLDRMGENGYLNQAYALDAQIGIGELSKIIMFGGLTDTPKMDKDNAYAFHTELARDTKQVSTSIYSISTG